MAAQPTTHDDEYLTAELGKQRGEYIKEGCSLIRSSSSRWTLGKWGKIYSTHPRSPHLLCTVPPLCHEKNRDRVFAVKTALKRICLSLAAI